MNEATAIESILFLDIETAPCQPDYSLLSERMQKLWDRKAKQINKSENCVPADLFFEKAGIYSEFAKIVCIGCGIISQHDDQRQVRLKVFANTNEKVLLLDFIELLNSHFFKAEHRLCAHNGREFDFPFLGRRILVNKLPLPAILNLQNKKPWEVQHIDTMELWKFGDVKNYTSLETLAAIFDVPTPKDDIDGSQVAKVFWKEEKGLERIAKYCLKDVLTLMQVYLHLKGMNALNEAEIGALAI